MKLKLCLGMPQPLAVTSVLWSVTAEHGFRAFSEEFLTALASAELV